MHYIQRALHTTIPQIGKVPLPTTTNHTIIPSTRDHPPFILPISKPLIDLYQLGDATTRPALDEATGLLSSLNASQETTTKDIDKATNFVIATLQPYHNLAQTIWPIAQTQEHTQPHKFYTPINTSDNRQIKCITRLRNSANSHNKPTATPKKPHTSPSTDTKTLMAIASEVLRLDKPPHLEDDIPSLCHKAISSIIIKANHKLAYSIYQEKRGCSIQK